MVCMSKLGVSMHIDLIIDFHSTPLNNLDLNKAINSTKSFKGHNTGHPLQAY